MRRPMLSELDKIVEALFNALVNGDRKSLAALGREVRGCRADPGGTWERLSSEAKALLETVILAAEYPGCAIERAEKVFVKWALTDDERVRVSRYFGKQTAAAYDTLSSREKAVVDELG